MSKQNLVLYIHIKTYHYKYFENFLKNFQTIQHKFKPSVNKVSIVHLPIKKKLYTVLRSPHVNKKAREQFNLKMYKMLIKISFNKINHFFKSFLYVLTLNAIGVSIKFEYNLN